MQKLTARQAMLMLGRHDLTPVGARIVYAGRRRLKQGNCFDTKLLDPSTLLDHIHSLTHGVVALEDHVERGIGSLAAEVITDTGVGKRLMRIGLRDTYAHGGSRPYLMRYYGLDALAPIDGIERLLGKEFDITEDDLDAARVNDVHSLVEAEAL